MYTYYLGIGWTNESTSERFQNWKELPLHASTLSSVLANKYDKQGGSGSVQDMYISMCASIRISTGVVRVVNES